MLYCCYNYGVRNVYLFSYKHPDKDDPKYVRVLANDSDEAMKNAPTKIGDGYVFHKFLGIDPECHP